MSQEWRLQAAPRELWPCQRNPERWFAVDRKELGLAIHECRVHCPRIRECWATEAFPMDGVLAGVLFNTRGVADGKQPPEVRCDACVFTAAPVTGRSAA